MTNRLATRQGDDFSQHPRQALWVLLSFVVFGVLVILAYAAVVQGKFLAIAGTGIMVAGASLFMGGLFGFLFGIPRAASAEGRQDQSQSSQTEYRPNTNLEQISDWLTKILVGVGLTQIASLPAAFRSVADYFEEAHGLGTWEGSGIFGLTIMLAYLVCGFLIGYLWTQLYMRIALAGQEQTIHRLGQIVDDLATQNLKNAEALELVDQQLNPPGGQPPVDMERLQIAVKQAAPSTQASIYSRAREKRREGWFDEKKRSVVALAVPVFEALIAAQKDYRYYGELGFALKDQDPPDWARAENALSQAIQARNTALPDWKERKWPTTFEANRAVCRIYQDPNFKEGKPASDDMRKAIADDLQIAKEGKMDWLFNKDEDAPAWSQNVYQDILKWMKLNGVPLNGQG